MRIAVQMIYLFAAAYFVGLAIYSAMAGERLGAAIGGAAATIFFGTYLAVLVTPAPHDSPGAP